MRLVLGERIVGYNDLSAVGCQRSRSVHEGICPHHRLARTGAAIRRVSALEILRFYVVEEFEEFTDELIRSSIVLLNLLGEHCSSVHERLVHK